MRSTRFFYAAGLALLAGATSHAQVTSTLQTLALSASRGPVVTLTSPTPSTQSVSLTDGALNPFPDPISTTVGWDVSTTTTTVKLVAYFTNPAQALASGSDYIPSSLIEVSTDGGTNWHALTDGAIGGVGTAGGSYTLYTSAVTAGSNRKSTHVVTFSVRVNLTTNPSLASGVFTGTLSLMAICN